MKHDESKLNNCSNEILDQNASRDDNCETLENIQNKLQINSMNVNIKNYRMDNFKQLRNKFDKLSVSTRHQKSLDLEKLFKNTNREKNDKVINQINSLLANIDLLTTKSTAFSPEVKDSLLNSYKDFIVVKENNKFNEGMPILELKKEQFLKNTKILEIKEKLERNSHKREYGSERKMLLLDELRDQEDYYRKQRRHKNENIYSTKNLGNNYRLNFNNNINNNEKHNFFSTGLHMRKDKIKNISPNKKILEMDLNRIFDEETKENKLIQSLNDERVLRKKFILPKINHKEVSVDLLPEKIDIYSKIKIKDLIGLSQLVKPIFKYK